VRSTSESLGLAAWTALRRLVRERLACRPGGHLVESQLGTLEVPLRLTLEERPQAAEEFTRRLVAAVDELLDDAVQQAAAFRPGHAYCHRCRDVACEHSRPPSSRHVFVGYAATGLPRWEDFAQYCLETKHPEVDRLYDDPPPLLTLVHAREALHAGLLEAFQNPRYELMGQLTAGFFPVRARAEEGRGVLALTIQVAASHGSGGRVRLGLNLLARAPAGEDLERLWERHDELPWRRSVRWAQAALQTVGPVVVAEAGSPHRARLDRRVDGILQGLARRLERDGRARSRRTRHAERRHASGERPTRKALDDARAAGRDTLLVDERTGTVVVLGDRGRTHFFTPQGQLVSSVRYSREAIERKLKLEQWRRAPAELSARFRASLEA
jgi:hypothetical protein